jgi:hypothetical protein
VFVVVEVVELVADIVDTDQMYLEGISVVVVEDEVVKLVGLVADSSDIAQRFRKDTDVEFVPVEDSCYLVLEILLPVLDSHIPDFRLEDVIHHH